MATMARLRERVEQRRRRSATCSRRCCDETGYLDALEAERTIEAQGRLENLEELVEVAREFDAAAEADGDTLDAFLQQIALVADADERRDDEGLVTLMTLHNAKGLEYPIVFIIGCEEGVFPHSRSLDEGDARGGAAARYVGITRAMRDLDLTYARRRNVVRRRRPTGSARRFLDEIPPDLDRVRPDAPAPRACGAFAGAGEGGGRRGRRPRGRAPQAQAPEPSGASFRLGEDVVHAAFGEGVVTGGRARRHRRRPLRRATARSASSWPSTRRSRSGSVRRR